MSTIISLTFDLFLTFNYKHSHTDLFLLFYYLTNSVIFLWCKLVTCLYLRILGSCVLASISFSDVECLYNVIQGQM